MTKQKQKKRPQNIKYNALSQISQPKVVYSSSNTATDNISQLASFPSDDSYLFPIPVEQHCLQHHHEELYSIDYNLILKKQLDYVSQFLSFGDQEDVSLSQSKKGKQMEKNNCLSSAKIEYLHHINDQLISKGDRDGEKPKIQKVNRKSAKQQKMPHNQTVIISNNWEKSIKQNFCKLNLSTDELLSSLHWANLQKVSLDMRVHAQKLLAQFFYSQSQISAQLSILLLTIQLQKYLDHNAQPYKIWLFDFPNASLLIHSFHQWLTSFTNQSSHPICMIPQYTQFISKMFIIFNHWGYCKNATDTLITESMEKS